MAGKLLASAKADEVVDGLSLLAYTEQMPDGNFTKGCRFHPGVVKALMHPDEEVRRAARAALHLCDAKDVAPLIDKLVADLAKDQKKDERLATLRALGALGRKAAKVQSKVDALIDDKDYDVSVAAAVAVDLINDRNDNTPGKSRLVDQVTKFLATLPEERRHVIDVEADYSRQMQAVYPPSDGPPFGRAGFYSTVSGGGFF